MRVLSVCSGIGTDAVAWRPLGWEHLCFAEIEKFPSAVLKYRWPDVPNEGDFTKIGDKYRGAADLLAKQGDTAAHIATGMAVRRLNPRECERLQGLPDDYTMIPFNGKPAADGPRYKAIGNGMAVPVLRWIGERIKQSREPMKKPGVKTSHGNTGSIDRDRRRV